MTTETILVVDDDASILAVCVRMLEGLGFVVDAAAGFEDALSALRVKTFDLVLTDLQMAASDEGVSLASEIKTRSPSTDVVLMTGQPSVRTAVSAMKHGACDYVSKPFEPGQLEAVVRRCMDKRRLSAELDRERTLRRELEAAYRELQKVERLKDAFLGRVNHELRTPVAVAVLAADALGGELSDERSRKIWEKLHASLDGLKDIVEDLLLFSRLTGKDRPQRRESVDLRALVDASVDAHRVLWSERDLEVGVACEGRPRPVAGDPELLKAAVGHLLLNAIRFNKKGGSLRVLITYLEREVRLAFTDTGIGIPKENFASLFDSFYQVAEHLTREVGGLGLGLATLRCIVEAHGGSISVDSELGRGSTFTVVLPESSQAAGNPPKPPFDEATI